LGERFNGIEEVVGSIPSGSTIVNPLKLTAFFAAGACGGVELPDVRGSTKVPTNVAVAVFTRKAKMVIALPS
jgi:hypothetical protein